MYALLYLGLALALHCSPIEAGTPTNCWSPPLSALPFCNTSLPTDARAADLVSRMTLQELYSQVVFEASAIPRLGVPAYRWATECLHGVKVNCTSAGRCPTSFPAPSATGAAFNMTLVSLQQEPISRLQVHLIASAISTEARALHNQATSAVNNSAYFVHAGLTCWSPNINIARDPRWGRAQEVPGEDPYLTSLYAKEFAHGLQEGADSRYVKVHQSVAVRSFLLEVVATCKHFAAYSIEDWEGHARFGFNALVSNQDLVDTYLPAFEACVVEGGARSVMCAYNSVNGIPACASSFLLQTILRSEWNFQGYVVSDCDAVANIFTTHNYTKSLADAATVALHAGTDLDCGTAYMSLNQSVAKGNVTQAQLATAVYRTYLQRFALGMFDDPSKQPYAQYGPELIDSAANQQLAHEAAQQSMVLLKNVGNILPISKSKTVAVIGPNANVTATLLGNYFGQRCADNTYSCIVTPLAAIQNKGVKTIFAHGCDINSGSTAGFAAAVTAAKQADVAVVFLGIDQTIEAEGFDRLNISLPGEQEALIQQILAAQKNTVVVLINGGALGIEWIAANVPGIIEAWYAGEMGGYAIADVLFGDYNPGGKLPITMYPSDFVSETPMTDFYLHDAPGRTYRYYTGTPIYAFGYGLSYTTFKITPINSTSDVTAMPIASSSTLYFAVNVTNTGTIAGDEVVQAYISPGYPGAPIRTLFGFQRVHLQPGQSQYVFFGVGMDTLAFADHNGDRVVRPHLHKIIITNGHSQSHVFTVDVHGDPMVTFKLGQSQK